jgi:type IV fimbrial biogenesis protein FimT
MSLDNSKALGFSLVELVIVVAILSIVVALGMPSYNAWIQNTRIRSAAESIQNGIQLARAESVKRNASVQFDLRGTNSAWTVCVRPSPVGSCPANDDATTIQSRQSSEGSSSDIAITTTDAMPLVFNSFGRMIAPVPAAADGILRISIDVNSTVLAATASRDLRVLVNAGGNIRMCDPATTLPDTDPRKCPA